LKIVVAVRCYNEEKNIERFLRGYDFADLIIVSDGGSTDRSLELLNGASKVNLIHFDQRETLNGETWNPDNPHINFVLDAAKAESPDWLIFDDMDCVPNHALRRDARYMMENFVEPQINAFRLYMWGDSQFFPYMNRNFNPDYRSLWAWKPSAVDVRADNSKHHGTIATSTGHNILGLDEPFCLLHKSWHPNTIDAKVARYNKLNIQTGRPETFAGEPAPLPSWAHE
jgi:glycosyltransferase involved in cell wall biosynthesis